MYYDDLSRGPLANSLTYAQSSESKQSTHNIELASHVNSSHVTVSLVKAMPAQFVIVTTQKPKQLHVNVE